MRNVIVATNAQKALNFLIRNPGKQFTTNEAQKGIKISKAGANVALRNLVEEKLVFRQKRAKIFLYWADHSNPVIKQLKVLQSLLLLEPLIAKIKNYSEEAVLFGSCARGEDLPDSDIDLFVLTNAGEEVKALLEKFPLKKKLQTIIRSPLQFSEMESKEPVFFEEIVRGITLWEAKR